MENNYLSVSEKSELEIQKQILQNSKDPAEREKAQQKYDALREKDIASDQKVIDACSNGNAGSAGCASARLEVIVAKGEYETGLYNNKVSDMYSDAYGQIVNLLNMTSVDAQNQQQVKDAMINYFMATDHVDYQTAKGYTETKEGMDILLASITPFIGVPAANKLSSLGKEANTTTSLLNEMSSQGIKYSPQNIVQVAKNADGKIIFLETGSPTSGLQHIIKEHGSKFSQIGVPEFQIPNIVMKAVSDGKVFGYQGAGSGRPIYETTINGKKYNIAITVGNNGYVVGANLRGEVKKIKLMADYGCYPLWGTTPDDFGDISPEDLSISSNLKGSLYNWAKRYDAILNMDDPASSGFKDKEEEEKFIKDGYELARNLQDELGNQYEVIYHSEY